MAICHIRCYGCLTKSATNIVAFAIITNKQWLIFYGVVICDRTEKKHYHKEVGRMDESDENNRDQQNVFTLEPLPRY